jgi:hypothetical protein
MRLKIILGKKREETMVVNAETGEVVDGVISVTFNDGADVDIYSVAISLAVDKVELEVAEPKFE